VRRLRVRLTVKRLMIAVPVVAIAITASDYPQRRRAYQDRADDSAFQPRNLVTIRQDGRGWLFRMVGVHGPGATAGTAPHSIYGASLPGLDQNAPRVVTGHHPKSMARGSI